MKQIEYTEKQTLVLEILERFDEEFKPKETAYYHEKAEYFRKTKRIKEYYGIKEKYLTLREYMEKAGFGAYHYFVFTIRDVKINVCGIADFGKLYNPALLDRYYVVSDEKSDIGGNCENYQCTHRLELAPKDD